jgi:hypothetical protein
MIWRFQKKVVPLQRSSSTGFTSAKSKLSAFGLHGPCPRIWETPRSVSLNLVLMFNRTIMYAKLAWVYAKESLFMKRKFRWIDLALLPFGLCVLFLLLLGKLFGLTYKQISVVFNLWVQGAVLALSGLAPFGIAVYKMIGSFSMWWLALSAVLLTYGFAYVYAFIKTLQHYHLPFDAAFDLCVDDLEQLAKKWHTTYQMVNLLIFILFYLILLGLNILICYYLYSL